MNELPGNVATDYGVAAVMLALSIGLGLLVVFLGRRAKPAPTRPASDSPPEFGGRTTHKSWVQFRVRYAVLALLFVAFDMEMVYMFPWSVVFRRVGIVALLDMFVFIAILTAAILFAWKEGAFDWER